MKPADKFRNTHWETLRGVWWPDTNRDMCLVKASVDEVGQALAGIGYSWRQDVLGKKVIIVDGALIVYRIRGHWWSCIVSESFIVGNVLHKADEKDLCSVLSAQLGTTTIHYGVGKTAGVRYYSLYQNGKEMELFTDLEGEMHFTSKRRKIRGKVADSRQFTDKFLRSQDALDSGISFEYFFRSGNGHLGTWKKGKAKKLNNPGMEAHFSEKLNNPGMGARFRDVVAVTRPPIERVDFLTPPD